MPQLELSERAYRIVADRAASEGFASVDDFIVDAFGDEATPDIAAYAPIFTPERLAEIERAFEEIRAGAPTYSIEEVRQKLAEDTAKWSDEPAN